MTLRKMPGMSPGAVAALAIVAILVVLGALALSR